MKTALLTSLTAKVAAGVAGVALLSGGAGTVLALQPAGERTLPPSAAEAALEATGREAATTTTTTTTTAAPTTTTGDDDDKATEDATKDLAEDTTEDEAKAHPDNFGAMVSEDAKDGGVDGQEISELAKARNEERRADRADKDDDDEAEADDEADDDEDDDDASPADAHRKDDGKGKPAED